MTLGSGENTGSSNLRAMDGFFASVERGDFEAFRAYYAPGATIWYADGSPEQTVDANVAMVIAVAAVVSNIKYDIRRRAEVEGGVFCQHVLRGVLPDGSELAFQVAMYLEIKDGLIHRIEEYFDPGALDKVVKAMNAS